MRRPFLQWRFSKSREKGAGGGEGLTDAGRQVDAVPYTLTVDSHTVFRDVGDNNERQCPIFR